LQLSVALSGVIPGFTGTCFLARPEPGRCPKLISIVDAGHSLVKIVRLTAPGRGIAVTARWRPSLNPARRRCAADRRTIERSQGNAMDFLVADMLVQPVVRR
jgi:hypothetical protein